MTEDRNRCALVGREPGDDGGIVRVLPIAVDLDEVGKEKTDVVERIGPLRMARYQRPLPRCQPRIGLAEQPVGGIFEAADLVGNVDLAGCREVAEFLDLALELGNRPFEIEKVTNHLRRASGCAVSTSLRSRSVSTCV